MPVQVVRTATDWITSAAACAPVPGDQSAQRSPPSSAAALSSPGQRAACGHRWATIARPARTSARAVINCSSCGLACGTTTAGFLAAATAAREFKPACVTTTSARHSAVHGSSAHRPVAPPKVVHLQPGVVAAAWWRSWRVMPDPPLPSSTSTECSRLPVTGCGARSSKRENAPTCLILSSHELSPSSRMLETRRENRLGERVAEPVRRITTPARQHNSNYRCPHQPNQRGYFSRDVDDKRRRRDVLDPLGDHGHPVTQAAVSQRCPVQLAVCGGSSSPASPSSRGSVTHPLGQPGGRGSDDKTVTSSVSRAAMHRAVSTCPWPRWCA